MKAHAVERSLETLFSGLLPLPETARGLEISAITSNSREVVPGTLFVALKGVNTHGKDFIPQAIKAGASAIFCDEDPGKNDAVPVIISAEARRIFSHLAARFYHLQPDIITAVTGTNGKTSVAHFCRQLWHLKGKKSASIGTTGITMDEQKYEFDRSHFLTTPEPVKLHQITAELVKENVTHLAMEASSHGLSQYRLDGMRLTTAAFTNFTQDHLDYHHTMEEYFDAKMRLFTEVLAPGSNVVINHDDPQAETVIARCQKQQHKVLTFGTHPDATLQLKQLIKTGLRQSITLSYQGKDYKTELDLVGAFQASNVLCALGMVMEEDETPEDYIPLLPKLKAVTGRMERVIDAPIFVDYAHTPDALIKALTELREITSGKLHLVFGCGGDRDTSKRALMGKAALDHADHITITDDNPRTEDPGTIRQMIAEACPIANIIASREEAISQAVAALKENDILLIAGKGHEKMQLIGTEEIPFDDVIIAKTAWEKKS